MSYEIIEKAKEIKHPFGMIYELSSEMHSTSLNISRAKINNDRRHYHKKATEIYYILNGMGVIDLADKNDENDKTKIGFKTHGLHPGTTIVIKPWTWHRVRALKGELDIIVASSPPYDKGDEFYD